MNEPARENRRSRSPKYLQQERASDTKHELINGKIFAMSGGTLSTPGSR